EYTVACAEALAVLLPSGIDGSISTLPLGFKPAPRQADFLDRCLDHLVDLAVRFDQLRQRTGSKIQLAIEPEPFGLLETTSEAIAFFQRLWSHAAARGNERAAREHLGLCYDVCHQAVEFEEASAAIQSLHAAGVPIAKVQISCAIEVRNPIADVAARS